MIILYEIHCKVCIHIILFYIEVDIILEVKSILICALFALPLVTVSLLLETPTSHPPTISPIWEAAGGVDTDNWLTPNIYSASAQEDSPNYFQLSVDIYNYFLTFFTGD